MPKDKKHTLFVGFQILTAFVLAGIITSCNPKREPIKANEPLMQQDSNREFITYYHTPYDFTLSLSMDSVSRVLAFRKHADSASFQFMNYQFSNPNPAFLKSEINYIDYLWKKALDSISIDLKGAMIGYPLEYDDILMNHINAVRSNKSLDMNDYSELREIMYQANIYKPFDGLLKEHGYTLNSISTEKHGRVPKENLLRLGYQDTLLIPVPFMVWLDVKKASE
ncbi:MAG: hypothetical protein RLO81_12035 [Fulvivirga sp.]|uniref:hypothetical protein n=1 Tax=Fulvivirga sp. TaxID=1931237 RepID=UPI0032ED069C